MCILIPNFNVNISINLTLAISDITRHIYIVLPNPYYYFFRKINSIKNTFGIINYDFNYTKLLTPCNCKFYFIGLRKKSSKTLLH